MSEPRRVPQIPLLTVIDARATPEEIAALVAVLAALGSSDSAPEVLPMSRWNAPHRLVRRPTAPGPVGWRDSGLPR